MELRIIMVEPEYDANVGYICRVMKNFAVSDLAIVNPKCPLGFEAVQFSKHAHGILKSAKICNTLEEAITEKYFVVGTTGIQKRNKDAVRSVIPLPEAVPLMKKKTSVALLLGREGIGLNPEELNRCDLLLTIPANPVYPVLNVSHALAVILYAVSSSKTEKEKRGKCPQEKTNALIAKFSEFSSANPFRKSELAPSAFRKLIARAEPTEAEADLLLGTLSRASRRSKGGD